MSESRVKIGEICQMTNPIKPVGIDIVLDGKFLCCFALSEAEFAHELADRLREILEPKSP